MPELATTDAKRFATMQADAALNGFELRSLDGGGPRRPTYVVSKWGLCSPELVDLAAVEAFLRRAIGRYEGPRR